MSTILPTQQPIFSSLGGDPEMAVLVEFFVAEMPERIERVESLLDSQDWEQLRTFAHQLKGSGGSYGFDQLTPLAANLEVASASADPKLAAAAAEKVIDHCQRAQAGTPTV